MEMPDMSAIKQEIAGINRASREETGASLKAARDFIASLAMRSGQ
jgi:hypothetical protein